MASQFYQSALQDSVAPDIATIRTIALQSMERLGKAIRDAACEVAIEVYEFPTTELADTLGLETPFDLLGIFEGRGARQYWTPRTQSSTKPVLMLFRRAILDYWAEHDETLGDVIHHVVTSELTHHFGSEIPSVMAAGPTLN